MGLILHRQQPRVRYLALLFAVTGGATALLYLAELVEEYTARARVVMQCATYTVLALHVVFLVAETLPFWRLLLSYVRTWALGAVSH